MAAEGPVTNTQDFGGLEGVRPYEGEEWYPCVGEEAGETKGVCQQDAPLPRYEEDHGCW